MSAAATVLPDDVAFDAEGHASEVALSALADGQIEILARSSRPTSRAAPSARRASVKPRSSPRTSATRCFIGAANGLSLTWAASGPDPRR